MKLALKMGDFRLLFALFKTENAVGIKSLCKDGNHILCMDFDIPRDRDKALVKRAVTRNLAQRKLVPMMMYNTENGFHVIVLRKFDFFDAMLEYVSTPFIDLDHFAIGVRRRYWFLETKIPIPSRENMQSARIKR